MPPQRAFTLVEFLVVIAVIAVVIGITIPVVSTVRRSSDTTFCANNLRQIASALNIYASENGGVIPGALGRHTAYYTWAHLVASYLAPKQVSERVPLEMMPVLACPAHPLTGKIETGFSMTHTPRNVPWDSSERGKPGSLGRVNHASTRIWLVDSANDFNGWSSWRFRPEVIATLKLTDGSPIPDPVYLASLHVVSTPAHLPYGTQRTVAVERHGHRRINAIFYDSHVELISGPDLKPEDFGLLAK